MPKYDDITITIGLSEPEGNAHAIADKVQRALGRMVCQDEAVEFGKQFQELIAKEGTDYEQVQNFCREWVNVKYKH